MKILVFSDTHGDTRSMLSAIRANISDTDLCIHLGDTVFDANEIGREFPTLACLFVRGNNDFYMDCPDDHVFEMAGRKIYVTHGHREGAHFSSAGVLLAAKRKGADIALFGHTHIPLCEKKDGMLLFNPGSLSRPRASDIGSYGILVIKNGVCDAKIIYTD